MERMGTLFPLKSVLDTVTKINTDQTEICEDNEHKNEFGLLSLTFFLNSNLDIRGLLFV